MKNGWPYKVGGISSLAQSHQHHCPLLSQTGMPLPLAEVCLYLCFPPPGPSAWDVLHSPLVNLHTFSLFNSQLGHHLSQLEPLPSHELHLSLPVALHMGTGARGLPVLTSFICLRSFGRDWGTILPCSLLFLVSHPRPWATSDTEGYQEFGTMEEGWDRRKCQENLLRF